MQAYSLGDINSKPFVEGFFELPKAIGRTAIQDGDRQEARSDNDHRDQWFESNTEDSHAAHDSQERFSSLTSMGVQ